MLEVQSSNLHASILLLEHVLKLRHHILTDGEDSASLATAEKDKKNTKYRP
jgi:hypothetical protein